MKASELLLKSAKPFDDGCLKVLALEECLLSIIKAEQLPHSLEADKAVKILVRGKALRQARHLMDIE